MEGDIIEAGAITLRPLRGMSPSRFSSAQECPLREALAANRVRAPLPSGPAARLGSAIHSLLEAAGKGDFAPGDGAAIDRKWAELLALTERAMRSSWLERHLVPFKDSVADFEVRRIQARERALELAETAVAAREAGAPAEQQYGCELTVSSPDGTVRGQIDAVVKSDQGPVVRDYKSGAIFEPRTLGQGILKPSYKIQLRIYAALYALTMGEWPVRLEIVPVLGEAQEVEFNRESCLTLLEDARQGLEAINSVLTSSRSSAEVQEALARPSPEVCRHCVYRPICGPYTRDNEARGVHSAAQDVWGEFENLQELGNGRLLIEISSGSATVRVRGVTPGNRHPALANLRAGDRVGVFNLRGTGSESTFAESPFTVVYRLNDDGPGGGGSPPPRRP